MPKSIDRRGRRRANALRPAKPRRDAAGARHDSLAPPARDPRPLLERILDTPHLAHVVPRLPAEVLHRVIVSCGLEDCAEIVALATPGQLTEVFDLDLWRAGQAGLDEQFDADRFGVWIEVLVESGAAAAAEIVAAMDVDLVIAGLSQHALVFDPAAMSPAPSMDGEDEAADHPLPEGIGCEIGGYMIAARRTDSWDAILAVLIALDADHHDCFHRVMRECRNLSNAGFELDGLDDLLGDDDQVMFDLAVDRERRREQRGYVAPGQGRAFLEMSRQLRLGPDSSPPRSPIARAYFQAIEEPADEDSHTSGIGASPGAPTERDSAEAVAALVGALVDAGVLPQPPRALLEGAHEPAPRLARIQAQLQFARDHDQAAYAARSQELAYLANTIVAGCSIQGRPFTAQEASDAATATCNLGLANWPPHWLSSEERRDGPAGDSGTALPDDFLVGHDLVGVFQAGWTVLHHQVCMDAAGRLINVLTRLRCADLEIQKGLDALRVAMTRQWHAGTPWHARDALDVIATLDMPAWATLLGLIDECPVIHDGIRASQGTGARAVSGTAFEFISENSQIASVREFMRTLPETLRR